MNIGKEQQLPKRANLNSDRDCFRFRTGKGPWLTDQIHSIEELATGRLRAGVSFHSVQTGALALLKLAVQDVSGEFDDVSLQPMRAEVSTPDPRSTSTRNPGEMIP